MSLENTHYGYERIEAMLKYCHSIFFIGIGGISMSALAQMSAALGYIVGGSDRTENPQTAQLREKGIPVFAAHDAANVARYDAVVYTVAISPDNPEYAEAKRTGKPLLSRSDYLGYLMQAYRYRIGISGMHGKSTCTAMCAQIFLAATDPTVLCGAELPALQGSTCRIGRKTDYFVFEACEYMDSFLDFYPTLAVILNVGMDHPDYFKSMDHIRSSFLQYANRTGEGGTVLYNADDVESIRALEPYRGRRVSFGINNEADFTARNIVHGDGVTEFDFCHDGHVQCHVRLHVFGLHNVYNALAAASAASLCGIPYFYTVSALESFMGAKRRMERKGVLNGAVVYDDYGHHPDEIRATLAGAREMGYRRVLCAYQPHTYSRTAALLESFTKAFGNADKVFFADIYAAREQNVYGVTSELLAQRIGLDACYCGSFGALAQALKQEAREGDLVIIMGAGDIYKVYDLLELD